MEWLYPCAPDGRKQLYVASCHHSHPSPFNLCTVLPAGRRWKLKEYVKAHMATLQRDYKKLSSREKATLRQGLDTTRESRVKTVRANPKAMAKYVDKTFDGMDKDVSEVFLLYYYDALSLTPRRAVDGDRQPDQHAIVVCGRPLHGRPSP